VQLFLYVTVFISLVSRETCSFIKPFQTGRCRFLFVLGRHTYITPTSYLELISSFKTLITQKQLLTMESKQRYVTGLEKLAFAAATVCTISHCHSFTCCMQSEVFYFIGFI